MKTCPYCLEDVNEKALRCPKCSSWMEASDAEQMASGQKVIYIFDRDLVRFSKFSISILAIFLIIGAFFYGFDLKKASDEILSIRDQVVGANTETQEFRKRLDVDKNNIDTTKQEVERILEETKDIKDGFDRDKEQINQAKIEVSNMLSETSTYRDTILGIQKEAEDRVSTFPDQPLTEKDVSEIVKEILVESGTLNREQLEALLDNAKTVTSTLDSILEQPSLEIIQAKQAADAVKDSIPVKVAVLADGVSTDISQIQGHLLEGQAFGGIVASSGRHFVAVVSLIAAIAPEAKILPLQVLRSDGGGSLSSILEGLDYAIKQDVRIIVLPFGGSGETEAYRLIVEKAQERNILIFAAAGNMQGEQIYPAATPGVLAVTSTDNEDQIASFANYGEWVALAAPGVGIVTLNSEGLLDNTISGSSASVAIAGGVAALTLSANPDLTANELAVILTLTSKPISVAEFEIGRIDALASVRLAIKDR